jgi:hypothetical protein
MHSHLMSSPALSSQLPLRVIERQGRRGASAALPSFQASGKALGLALAASRRALRRARAARHRLEASRAWHDTREWLVKRRERTRHLIELGGLVVKAGLVELVDDDRAVMLGLLTEAAARLRSEEREQLLTLWQRRGKRAFAAADDGGKDLLTD